MLNIDDGIKAIRFARKVLEYSVGSNSLPEEEMSGVFSEKYGAFITILTYPNYLLRGCMGIPYPIMSLKEAIKEGALSVTKDPRFPRLQYKELDKIVVEITILTKPIPILVDRPEDYINNIKIGRDGLIIEKGLKKGLLLPQVPVEQSWDEKEFLCNACLKAGILPDGWFDSDIKISTFRGQIFSEIRPKGNVKEKKLDGSSC
jgi:uncharacterized protein (TIGR00296 family)